ERAVEVDRQFSSIEDRLKALESGQTTLGKCLTLDPGGAVTVQGALMVKGSTKIDQDLSARGVTAKTYDGRVLVIRDEREGAAVRLGECASEPDILWFYLGTADVKGGTIELRLGKDGIWKRTPFVIKP